MVIETLFAASCGLVVATKLADLWTTWRNVDSSSETNPFGALLFRRTNVGVGVLVVGLLAAAIIGVSYGTAWAMGPAAQLAVAALGVPIAVVQGAVAWTNHTRRFNGITRRIRRLYNRCSLR